MSIIDYDCFGGVIGLSRTVCDCYEEPPLNWDLSYSGLYLDELEPLNRFSALLNCETGTDLWELMERCREQAVIASKSDVTALLMERNKLRRQPFYGAIGNFHSDNDITVDYDTIFGVRLFCANIVGGIIKIKKIGTVMNATIGLGDMKIYVYNNLNEYITTISPESEALKHKIITLPTELELPMHSPYVENLEYYFFFRGSDVAQYPFKPRNIKIKCDCGHFKPVFDTHTPYFIDDYHPHPKSFDSRSNNAYGWSKYVMVGGFVEHSDEDDFSDVDFTDLGCTASNYMYGITFPDITFKCKVSDLLCDDDKLMDFEANPLAMAIAHMVWYKAGELCINGILSSKNINFETMINREQLQESRDAYKQKYNELSVYIAENLNIHANDCLECKDNYIVTKGGILS